MNIRTYALLLTFAIFSPQSLASGIHNGKQVSFANAVNKLSKQHQPIVLQVENSRAAVLAEFQGRVMVTSLAGESGTALGWVNYDYLAKPNTDNNSATGGASRLWFGPETGPYSVFFRPGKAQAVENIQVPEAVSLQAFRPVKKQPNKVVFQQNLSLVNNLGFEFSLGVDRTISLYSQSEIAEELGIEFSHNLKFAGFSAHTKITNIGKKDWHPSTGILNIWELGAFDPSDNTVVFMPIEGALDKVTSYFSPTVSTHTLIRNGVVYYKGDGKYMNKIGIPPVNATSLLGSYDPKQKLLSVFSYSSMQRQALYNNSVWYEDNYHPYQGDVINIFNDGVIGEEGPFGPFYEVETSSSAKPLKVGERHQHVQHTYHFQGDKAQLENITQSLFGLSLKTIETVFAN